MNTQVTQAASSSVRGIPRTFPRSAYQCRSAILHFHMCKDIVQHIGRKEQIRNPQRNELCEECIGVTVIHIAQRNRDREKCVMRQAFETRCKTLRGGHEFFLRPPKMEPAHRKREKSA